jgi:CxxC motif-containing protein
VPRDSVFAVLEEARRLHLAVPIEAGSVLIQDVAHTGVALIATKDLTV